jgi:hypothetical protein
VGVPEASSTSREAMMRTAANGGSGCGCGCGLRLTAPMNTACVAPVDTAAVVVAGTIGNVKHGSGGKPVGPGGISGGNVTWLELLTAPVAPSSISSVTFQAPSQDWMHRAEIGDRVYQARDPPPSGWWVAARPARRFLLATQG